MSYADNRPAGENVDVERGTDVESGDETGSDEDDEQVVFNPPIASMSAAGGEMVRQIQLEREKSETIRMLKFSTYRFYLGNGDLPLGSKRSDWQVTRCCSSYRESLQ